MEHSNEELFVTSSDSKYVVGIDMATPGSPSIISPNDAENSFPGLCPIMPWDFKPKVVEQWLQMFQVSNVPSFRLTKTIDLIDLFLFASGGNI